MHGVPVTLFGESPRKQRSGLWQARVLTGLIMMINGIPKTHLIYIFHSTLDMMLNTHLLLDTIKKSYIFSQRVTSHYPVLSYHIIAYHNISIYNPISYPYIIPYSHIASYPSDSVLLFFTCLSSTPCGPSLPLLSSFLLSLDSQKITSPFEVLDKS